MTRSFKILMVCLIIPLTLAIVNSTSMAQLNSGLLPYWVSTSPSNMSTQLLNWVDYLYTTWNISSDNLNYFCNYPWCNPLTPVLTPSLLNLWDNSFNLFKYQSDPFQPIFNNPVLFKSYPCYTQFYKSSKQKHEPVKPAFENPKIIKIGALYAQFNEPYRYLFITDYKGPNIEVHNMCGDISKCSNIFDLMLNPCNFLCAQDPNDPNDPVVRYWTDMGADPNKFGIEPDPVISALMGREFTVDLDLFIFDDPNLRLGGSIAQRFIKQGTLTWNATANGSDINGLQDVLLKSLPVDPYDGIPTYLPTYYAALDAIWNLGKPYYQPGLVYLLEGSLWNAGVTVWPNIAAFDYTPHSFEDINMTIEVTNGIDSDAITFPIFVVDYPMENYAPVPDSSNIELTFYVGKKNLYAVKCIDPDCFIFSMSDNPTTNHGPGFPISTNFRTDMDDLHWEIALRDGVWEFDRWYSKPYGLDWKLWITYLFCPLTGLMRYVASSRYLSEK